MGSCVDTWGMLITAHAAAGASIGAAIGRPIPAFLAGFASHFAMDATTHWGPHREGGGNWRENAFTDEFMRVAVTDGCAGLATIPAYLLAAGSNWPSVAAGIAGACLPDLNKPCLVYGGFSPFPRRMDTFHAAIQMDSPHRLKKDAMIAGGLVVAALVAVKVLSRRR